MKSELHCRLHGIGIFIGLTIFSLLLATESGIGITWDEPIYSAAAENAAAWLGRVISGDIIGAADPYNFGMGWGLVNEAPPLVRIVSGLGWALTKDWLPLPTAHRVGNMALAAIILGALTTLISRQRNLRIGIFSVVALLTIPRVFYHAHLGTLDFPLAAIWTLGTLIFYQHIRGLQATTIMTTRIKTGVLYSSFVIGTWAAFALLTKINAVLLAPFWALWVLIYIRQWRAIFTLILAPFSTAIVLYCGFPWLWKAPISGIQGWIGEYNNHYVIGQWFGGQWIESTPWSMPFLILGTTIPVILLLLSLIGLLSRQNKGMLGSPWLGLHFIGLLIICLYFALPFNNLHDQERMLLPAVFHIAILSAEGLERLWQRTLQQRSQWVWAAIVTLALLPNVWGIIRTHPYELAYYNELVGGINGAQEQGMESIYFASTYAHFLPALNALPPDSKLWVMPNSWGVIYYYQLNGMLRPDLIVLRPSGWGSFYDGRNVRHAIGLLRDADYAIIERRQTAFNGETSMGQMQIEWTNQKKELVRLERDGVILATLHQNENQITSHNSALSTSRLNLSE